MKQHFVLTGNRSTCSLLILIFGLWVFLSGSSRCSPLFSRKTFNKNFSKKSFIKFGLCAFEQQFQEFKTCHVWAVNSRAGYHNTSFFTKMFFLLLITELDNGLISVQFKISNTILSSNPTSEDGVFRIMQRVTYLQNCILLWERILYFLHC